MPPNIIAPNRPLPIGSASFQAAAGWRYHRVNGARGVANKDVAHPNIVSDKKAAGSFTDRLWKHLDVFMTALSL
jgi:hypothetical protein